MEYFNEIMTLVGSYGFPMICCLMMMRDKRETETKLMETVNANTMAVNNLSTLITHFISGGGHSDV